MLLIVAITIVLIIMEQGDLRRKQKNHDPDEMINRWKSQREERERRIKQICENNDKIWNNKGL